MRFLLPLLLACSSPLSALRAEPPTYHYENTVDFGDVTAGPMLTALKHIVDLADSGAKNVTLRIDSFGGSIFLGHKWIRVVEEIKKRNGMTVTCIVDGSAYSMAAVVLESPVCDRRLATARSTILFHNGSSSAEGSAEDLKSAGEFLAALNKAMALVVSGRLGLALEVYEAKIQGRDWVMAVPEALKANVLDGIVPPGEIAPANA